MEYPEFEELKNKTIAQQRAKLETYNALKEMGYPIPWDLRQEIEYAQDETEAYPGQPDENEGEDYNDGSVI